MDKVKLHAQERLDLDDTRALQSLIYDYVQEALGGLMGNAHGVLSVPQAFTSENGGAPIVYFRPFTFLTSMPMEIGSTGQPLGTSVVGGTEYTQFKSTVVNYDPEEQATQGIDIDGLRADFDNIIASLGPQYIWARPVQVDTDTATRRKWDVVSGAEVTVSVETRESQRVAFVIQNAEPSYATGEARWAKIAQITGFTDGDNTGSAPNIKWFSVFDDPLIEEFLETTGDITMSLLFNNSVARADEFPFDSANKSYRTFALPLLLSAIREQIRRIKGTSLWLGENYSSLTNLNSRTTVLENRQFSPVQCIANCTVGITVENEQYQRFAGEYVGNSYGVDRTYSQIIRPIGQPQNRAQIKLDTALVEQSWAITHISVQQHRQRSLVDADGHFDYNRVTFIVDEDVTTVPDISADGVLLLDYAPNGKGVVIEFLPQVITDNDQTHTHAERVFHVPTGSTSVTEAPTTVLVDLDAQGAPQDGDYDLLFSISVFAVPSADADN